MVHSILFASFNKYNSYLYMKYTQRTLFHYPMYFNSALIMHQSQLIVYITFGRQRYYKSITEDMQICFECILVHEIYRVMNKDGTQNNL